MLSKKEKDELLALSGSLTLQKDMRLVSKSKHPFLIRNSATDLDLYVTFLTEYNAMFNHDMKPRRNMIDNFMEL